MIKLSPNQRPWFYVLVVCIVASILLYFIGDRDANTSPDVVGSDTQPRYDDGEPQSTESQPERRATLRRAFDLAVPTDSSWLEGITEVADLGFSEEHPQWNNPPAAHPAPPGILARQEAAAASAHSWLALRLKATNLPSNDDYQLRVQRGEHVYTKRLPLSERDFGPFSPDAETSRIWLERRGGFFSSAKTATSVAEPTLNALDGSAVRLELTPFSDFQSRLGTEKLTLEAKLVEFDPDSASGQDDTENSAKHFEAEALSRFLEDDFPERDTVSFSGGDARDYFNISTEYRYTGVLFFSSKNLSNYLRCQVPGSDEVLGSFHPRLGLYALATSGRSALSCKITVYAVGQGLEYSFIAVGDQAPPFKSMVLAFLGRHLADLRLNDAALTQQEIQQAFSWLKRVYGVTYTEADLNSFTTPENRDKFRWLTEDGHGR